MSRPFVVRAFARRGAAFTLTDLLVVLAVVSVLAAVVVPVVAKTRATARLELCKANLQQVGRATLLYAEDHNKTLPAPANAKAIGVWFGYKDMVKGFVGPKGAPAADNKVFACPSDRGYGEGLKPVPFRENPKFNHSSYVFNGVHLPGLPHIAGRELGTIKDPARTLLVMEWTAHAPLSWHRSKTGRENSPFYNDAESVVAFVDGRVALTKIYYDGFNAAFTRDPVPGYDYKYSGD